MSSSLLICVFFFFSFFPPTWSLPRAVCAVCNECIYFCDVHHVQPCSSHRQLSNSKICIWYTRNTQSLFGCESVHKCVFGTFLTMTLKEIIFFFTLLQIVCVPFEWRVKLFLIVLVNAAVSVLVEVRHTHTLTHKETKIECFSFFSCSVLVVCLLFCLFFSHAVCSCLSHWAWQQGILVVFKNV